MFNYHMNKVFTKSIENERIYLSSIVIVFRYKL